MNILDDIKSLRKLPYENTVTRGMIIDIIENVLYSMFDYKKFPSSMPRDMAERYFTWQASCGALKLTDAESERYNNGMYKGSSVFLSAQPSAEPDFYGFGSKVNVTSANGYCEEKNYDDVAFGWGNSAHTDMRAFICMVADAITEALSAVRSGVQYSKNHPIYKAADDKEAAALQKYWKDVKDNKEELSITSPNQIQQELLSNATSSANRAEDKVINLSDPQHANKIQYLIAVVNEYIRWAFSLFGQDIQGGDGKLAQQSVEEVTGRTSTSFILPNDMLYQRRKWCDRMKELGIIPEDAEIDFSTAWKVEQIKYEKAADINNNGDVEELEDINDPDDVSRETSEEEEVETNEEILQDQ